MFVLCLCIFRWHTWQSATTETFHPNGIWMKCQRQVRWKFSLFSFTLPVISAALRFEIVTRLFSQPSKNIAPESHHLFCLFVFCSFAWWHYQCTLPYPATFLDTVFADYIPSPSRTTPSTHADADSVLNSDAEALPCVVSLPWFLWLPHLSFLWRPLATSRPSLGHVTTMLWTSRGARVLFSPPGTGMIYLNQVKNVGIRKQACFLLHVFARSWLGPLGGILKKIITVFFWRRLT